MSQKNAWHIICQIKTLGEIHMFALSTIMPSINSREIIKRGQKGLEIKQARIFRLGSQGQKAPSPIPQSDEIRERVNEVLRRVDHLIRTGNYEQVQVELMEAKKYDPTNIYIRAFEERLAILRKEDRVENLNESLKRIDRYIRLRDFEDARHEIESAKSYDPANLYLRAFEERLDHLINNHRNVCGGNSMEAAPSLSPSPASSTEGVLETIEHNITTRNINRAFEALEQLKRIDPCNSLIPQYEKRIETLSQTSPLAALHKEADQPLTRHDEAGQRNRALEKKAEEELWKKVRTFTAMKAWDLALEEIARGKKLDPTNKYLYSLEERLIQLKQETEQGRSKNKEESHATSDVNERSVPVISPIDSYPDASLDKMKSVQKLLDAKLWDRALIEIRAMQENEPDNADLRTIEKLIITVNRGRDSNRDGRSKLVEETKEIPPATKAEIVRDAPLQVALPDPIVQNAVSEDSKIPNSVRLVYAACVRQAWSDGVCSDDEKKLLLSLQKELGLTETDRRRIEHEIQIETYVNTLVSAWRTGAVNCSHFETLDRLREEFNIPGELHLFIEQKVRKEIVRCSDGHDKIFRETMLAVAPLINGHIFIRTRE
jgi:hypothetical protein